MFLQIVCNIVWGMVLVLSVPIGFLSFPLALNLLVRVGHRTSLTFDDSVERLKALSEPTILCVSHEFKCLDGWNLATIMLSCPGKFSLVLEDELPNRIFFSLFNLHRRRQRMDPIRVHFVSPRQKQRTVEKLVQDAKAGYSPIVLLRADKQHRTGVYHLAQQTMLPLWTVRMAPTAAMFSGKPWFMPIGYSMRTTVAPYPYDPTDNSEGFNKGLFALLLQQRKAKK